MDEDAFWALIGTLPQHLDDEAFVRLIERLAGRSPDEITAFADHLARALHELDTPAHFAAVRLPLLTDRGCVMAVPASVDALPTRVRRPAPTSSQSSRPHPRVRLHQRHGGRRAAGPGCRRR